MRVRLWLVAALIAPALHASELVYRPVNPSFGGNPLNSSHLLGTANAQNDYKDPASDSGSSGTSALDRLTSNLQSRLISQLLADIGKDGSQSGSLVTDDFAINVVDEDGTLVVSITDRVTNQTTMIEVNGAEKTEEILKGWVNNLSTDVFSDDIAVLEAINAGQCDVGIVNTYYFGRLHKANPQLRAKLFWPNQADRGVHVNLSGAGVTQHAPHAEAAQQLLEWMTSAEAQSLFADVNQEYPANPAVKPSAEVAAWGAFKADSVPVEVAGKRQAEATKLMDRAGWN